MSNYHVTQKKGQEGWNVQKENGERASAIVGTQKEAEKLAKQYSVNSGGGEIRIHRPNGGSIRDSESPNEIPLSVIENYSNNK